MYIYIYRDRDTYMHIMICAYIYIYVYIYIHIYVCMCMHIYIYIYILHTSSYSAWPCSRPPAPRITSRSDSATYSINSNKSIVHITYTMYNDTRISLIYDLYEIIISNTTIIDDMMCIYTYIYIYIYIHTHIYLCIYIYIYIRTHDIYYK